MRRTITVLALPLLALATGCSGDEPGNLPAPADTTTRAAPVAVPADEPGIRGVITDARDGAIRVETDPGVESGSPKAIVRLTPQTIVLFRSGEPLDPTELTLGHNVSVWFTGPVAESYPVQATASAVVVEPITP